MRCRIAGSFTVLPHAMSASRITATLRSGFLFPLNYPDLGSCISQHPQVDAHAVWQFCKLDKHQPGAPIAFRADSGLYMEWIERRGVIATRRIDCPMLPMTSSQRFFSHA